MAAGAPAAATLMSLLDTASGRLASPATLTLEPQPLDAARHVWSASPVTPQHWVLRHASSGEWLVADALALRVALWPAATLPPGPPAAAAVWRVDGGGGAPCALSVDDAGSPGGRLYLGTAPSGALVLSRAPPSAAAPWRVISHTVGGLVTRAALLQACASLAPPPRPQRVALWSMAAAADGTAEGGWLSSTGKGLLGIGPFAFSLWLAQELGTWEVRRLACRGWGRSSSCLQFGCLYLPPPPPISLGVPLATRAAAEVDAAADGRRHLRATL
jgi:hypothetical protein